MVTLLVRRSVDSLGAATAEKLRADLEDREKQRKQSADAAKRKVRCRVMFKIALHSLCTLNI